jgi:AAA family ATP:ADP antiporter
MLTRTLYRLVDVQEDELKALVWSFLYFFLLLCSYYILRPVRDEMGILGGIKNLPWVFTGTFIAMLVVVPLFGWVSARFTRQQFLPLIYGFFIVNLLLFYGLFTVDWHSQIVARAFFIWISVFNLFVVSVFWSFMNDLFDQAQAKRLFGVIAAGGTAGAITGPAVTSLMVQSAGVNQMLLLSALLLSLTIICIRQLSTWYDRQARQEDRQVVDRPMGGSWLAGVQLVLQSPYLLGISLVIILYSTLSTILYLQQASIIQDSFSDSAQRTSVFAMIDLAVNALTVIIQLFITSRLIKHLGMPLSLALIPLLLIIGFVLLAIAPVLSVLIAVQILRRAGNYAIMRPAREMLYSVLGREEKYKAKNFIDTVVYRGGDAASAWVYDGLRGMGLGIGQIAMLAAPLAAIWAVVSWQLGVRREQQVVETDEEHQHG